MNKGLIIAGFTLIGLGFTGLFPLILLSLASSPITGETDAFRLIFNSLSQIPGNNTATAQVINSANGILNFADVIPFIFIIIGIILFVTGLIIGNEGNSI